MALFEPVISVENVNAVEYSPIQLDVGLGVVPQHIPESVIAASPAEVVFAHNIAVLLVIELAPQFATVGGIGD